MTMPGRKSSPLQEVYEIMKADEIIIKIYNMPTIRMDLAEKWMKEYAMNVAHQAYVAGYEDGYGGIKPNPQVALSEIDPDNHN